MKDDIQAMRKVELTPYDPAWPDEFSKEAASIKEILGAHCLAIHHIGSTAIPGCSAKPIIDILPVVADLTHVDSLNSEFEKLGYQCEGEYGIPGRRFYWKSIAKCSHHIHFFMQGSPEIERHLAFRDHLHDHPDSMHAYSIVKKQLALQFPLDIVAYVNGKESFISAIDYITGHPRPDQLAAKDYIELIDSDPNWPKLAAAEIEAIKLVVQQPYADIKHLGSTAINEMKAKPVLDIFIALDSLDDVDSWIKPLENLGYVFWKDNPNKKHLRFFKGMPPYGVRRTHHVHIMEVGDGFNKRKQFCEILNSDNSLRQSYKQLKLNLAAHYADDREQYTHKKAVFIKKVLGN